MTVAFTGHRPDKLGGYSADSGVRLELFARQQLQAFQPDLCIVGMALGWDTAVAVAANDMGIDFDAYVPFAGQESMWPAGSQTKYRILLSKARRVVEVCKPPFSAWKMQKRNERMVDDSDLLIALWNGTSGGTANCVHYAETVDRPFVNVWDDWKEF